MPRCSAGASLTGYAESVNVLPIEEYVVPGKRLGRHVEHDPRSRNFAFAAAAPVKLVTRRHRSYGLPLNQLDLGSCTGNAAAGVMNSVPLRTKGKIYRESDAVEFYKLATVLDEFDGAYPPDDTGSSGLGVAKALKQLGLITSYEHAFGLDQALAALQEVPVIAGISWYEGFDRPDADGFIEISGQVRGGHEILIASYVAARDPYVEFPNSWGLGYGIRGRAKMRIPVLSRLLDEQGDVTILRR